MFLKLGPRKHEFPVAALLPNILTAMALFSGLAALHFASKPDWNKALAAVAISALFDALDGRAARLLRVTSGFGAILDSLSDFLAFGVAPAFMLHRWLIETEREQMAGRAGAFALAGFMTYALCAALRLARFTADAPVKSARAERHPAVEKGPAEKHHAEKPSNFFTGMPSPAAAGAVLIPLLLAQSETTQWRMPAWGVIAFAFVLGLLMVTRIPMFSLKSIRLGRRSVAPLFIAIGLVGVGLIRDPWLTLACVGGAYVISIPITVVVWWRRRAAEAAEAHPQHAA